MNSVIIGQPTEINQNSSKQKNAVSSTESSKGDSFEKVLAATDEKKSQTDEVASDELQVSAEKLDLTDAGPADGVEEGQPADDGLDASVVEEPLVAKDVDALPVEQTAEDADVSIDPEQEQIVGEAEVAETAAAFEDVVGDGKRELESSVESDAPTHHSNRESLTAKERQAVLEETQLTDEWASGSAEADQVEAGLVQQRDVASEGVQSPQGQPIESNLPETTDKVPDADLVVKSAQTIEELPLVYQVRLGAMPTTAQHAVDQITLGRAKQIGSVSPVAMKIQQSLSQKTMTEGQAQIDAETLGNVELLPKGDVEFTNPATARQVAPTNAVDVAKATAATSNVLQRNIQSENQSTGQNIQSTDALDASADDRLIRTELSTTGSLASPTGLIAPNTSMTQNSLASQFAHSLKQDASKQRVEVETRFVQDVIGINQALTEAVARTPAAQGREVVQRIAAQLGEAFASKGERKVDVMLNPKELGNVKMQLNTSESGVRVMIVTERSETGDLMRRHIDALEKEFREMGFENISFQFSGGDAQSQSNGNSGGTGTGNSADDVILDVEDAATPTQQTLNLGGSGLDMRV